MYRFLSTLLPLTFMGCVTEDPGIIIAPGDTSNPGDHTAPLIVHEPVEGAQVLGEPVPITAQVTDEESVIFVVQVFYRQETSSMWEDVALLDPDGDGTYEGQIPGSDVMTGGMYYYLYAMDTSENEAQEPDEGEDDPFHFRIAPADG